MGSTPPTHLSVVLHETATATLNWAAPSNPDRYELRVFRFNGASDETVALSGTALSHSIPLTGSACFRLTAFSGATTLGNADLICAVPNIADYPSGAGGAGRIATTLQRLLGQSAPLAPRRPSN